MITFVYTHVHVEIFCVISFNCVGSHKEKYLVKK